MGAGSTAAIPSFSILDAVKSLINLILVNPDSGKLLSTSEALHYLICLSSGKISVGITISSKGTPTPSLV